MMTDPIADFLIQIKNGYMAGKKDITVPGSKMKLALAQVLSKTGLVGKIEAQKNDKAKNRITVELIYNSGTPVLEEIKLISKPGKRVYTNRNSIPKVLGGLGKVIISTPKGIMTGDDARKMNLGGELICKIW